MSTRGPALPEPQCEWGPRHFFVPHPRHENVAMGGAWRSSELKACPENAKRHDLNEEGCLLAFCDFRCKKARLLDSSR